MSEKKNRIKPEILGGFRDYLPELMIPRQKMIDKIRQVFESFGFLPLETPALEHSSVLGTDRDEFKMEVYRFKAGEQDVTLRFDLTVPLSRVIAAYPKIVKPFKRYQVGSVWRREKPQAGRYREFMQFDADTVGAASVLADAEIILLMYEAMRALDLENFVIRFNNRKILNGLPEVAGFDKKKAMDAFRILDKLEKIGLQEVIRQLRRPPDNKYDDVAIGVSDAGTDKIKEFIALSSGGDLTTKLREFFRGIAIAEEGISECEQIINVLTALAIPERNWKLDLSIARGLGYYTGPVFETTLTDLPEIGSVFSGGRYDELVMRYTGEKIPATGASIGVDRLVAALEKLGKIKKETATAWVLVCVMANVFAIEAIQLAQRLRKENIKTEVYLSGSASPREQIIYAAKRGIRFVAILGEDEERCGKIKLRDMVKREEYLLTEAEFFVKLEAWK